MPVNQNLAVFDGPEGRFCPAGQSPRACDGLSLVVFPEAEPTLLCWSWPSCLLMPFICVPRVDYTCSDLLLYSGADERWV